PEAQRFFQALKVFTPAESLGGVESLAAFPCVPWSPQRIELGSESRTVSSGSLLESRTKRISLLTSSR
ncbi:hypothetical protein PENTCL1PPCAC_12975, partial [Pristionchus entomophagus]